MLDGYVLSLLQDVIFEALALECGHVFCASCALKCVDAGNCIINLC